MLLHDYLSVSVVTQEEDEEARRLLPLEKLPLYIDKTKPVPLSS